MTVDFELEHLTEAVFGRFIYCKITLAFGGGGKYHLK